MRHKKSKDRIECSIEVFNKILENSGLNTKIDPYEWNPTPAFPSHCFIEIWSDGTVYGIDNFSFLSHDLFYNFFEGEDEWVELQEEIKEIKNKEE
ncbi:MAG: hypothetical protein ACOCRX_06355 [Candidatus Woesearchaeota archaeon]